MKNLVFVFLLIFANCSDDNNSPPNPTDYKDAIQLAVGNKWVYEVKSTNKNTGDVSNEENEIISILDALKCNGSTAFNMASSKNYFFERIVIDSAGNLIDCYNENIIFSGVQIDDTLYEDSNMLVRMTEANKNISVPVGTFKTVNYQTMFKESGEVWNHYYANGVGLVKQVYNKQKETIEHILIEYELK